MTHGGCTAEEAQELERQKRRRRRRKLQAKAAAEAQAQADAAATAETAKANGSTDVEVPLPAPAQTQGTADALSAATGTTAPVVGAPGADSANAGATAPILQAAAGGASRTPAAKLASVNVELPSSFPLPDPTAAVGSDVDESDDGGDSSSVDGWSDDTSSDDARVATKSVTSSRHVHNHQREGHDHGQFTLYSSGDEDDDVILSAGTVTFLSPDRVAAALNLWRRRCQRLARRVTALENALVGASSMRRGGAGFPGVGWVFTPRSAATIPGATNTNAEGGVGQCEEQAGVVASQEQFQTLWAAMPRRRPPELLAVPAGSQPRATPLVGQLQRYVQKVYRQQRELWYGQKPADDSGLAAGQGNGGHPVAGSDKLPSASRMGLDGVDATALADEAAEDAAEFGGAATTAPHNAAGDGAPRWEDPWWLVSNLRRAAAAWQRGTHAQDHGCWVWFARNLVLRKAVQMATEVRHRCGTVPAFHVSQHVRIVPFADGEAGGAR